SSSLPPRRQCLLLRLKRPARACKRTDQRLRGAGSVRTAATSWRVGLGGGNAIVLAGGRGTRLAPVLPDRQKVTADVAGVPFVRRVVHWLQQAGMTRIVLAAGARADDVAHALAVEQPARTQIIISEEWRTLG